MHLIYVPALCNGLKVYRFTVDREEKQTFIIKIIRDVMGTKTHFHFFILIFLGGGG